jgi:hypothetical protein
MSIEISTVPPGGTLTFSGEESGAPKDVPSLYTTVYAVVHVQVPIFLKRQVFVKDAPGCILVPSGKVTSEMNCAWSQASSGVTGVLVGVAVNVSVGEGVSVGVLLGVSVDVGVAVGVSVEVCVAVAVSVLVAVSVDVAVAVSVAVYVYVAVKVCVAVGEEGSASANWRGM